MAIALCPLPAFNPQSDKKMPAKKKTKVTKLKDLKPKKDVKAGTANITFGGAVGALARPLGRL
jgi:hypothetical protein